MKENKKKINPLLAIAGFFMIISSSINYFYNSDDISLGIFSFAGIGFILLAIKDTQKAQNSQRIYKYAMLFFMLSVMLLLYWFAVAKLKLF
jgi:hypothetical protein